ncbi:MAG: hypothetical protein M1820_010920 [Bogoriella megaspora]|nr:MAG: hypothetical protein M1820_010920 [Bogoriella megaspora]
MSRAEVRFVARWLINYTANAMTQSRLRREDYTVGWISALPIEKAAALCMLDGLPHTAPPLPNYDRNNYTFGRVGEHNVVMACMPSGAYGTTSAAVIAESMMRTFTSIRFNLMVGIGGGVPNATNDIRLGDVVVSTGVIQYDYGKTIREGRFTRTAFPVKPPLILLNAISTLQANHISFGYGKMLGYLSAAAPQSSNLFAPPGMQRDCLFEPQYDHFEGWDTCASCDPNRLVRRNSRSADIPMVHYGSVASANQVMKHGTTRERLGKELNVLCFEMEAAGLIDHFQCLTIRGICDYSDSHKNKYWQPYASATAAAYAKELLSVIPESKMSKTEVVGAVVDREGILQALFG